VCVSTGSSGCTSDSQCGTGYICNSNHVCVSTGSSGCTSSSQCASGQTCNEVGNCVPTGITKITWTTSSQSTLSGNGYALNQSGQSQAINVFDTTNNTLNVALSDGVTAFGLTACDSGTVLACNGDPGNCIYVDTDKTVLDQKMGIAEGTLSYENGPQSVIDGVTDLIRCAQNDSCSPEFVLRCNVSNGTCTDTQPNITPDMCQDAIALYVPAGMTPFVVKVGGKAVASANVHFAQYDPAVHFSHVYTKGAPPAK
jgi:hypothetical protein